MLTTDTLPQFQTALRDANVDGWLLFDFRGTNPIASGLIGLDGMVSRRVFAWIPRDGTQVGERMRAGEAVYEHELQQRIREAFDRAGLETNHGPNVSAGANAANPHYEPSPAAPRQLVEGELLLIDLWAGEPGNPYADQT